MNALLLSLLAGAILPTAFAPLSLWPIAILSPALFLLCLTERTSHGWQFVNVKTACLRSFSFGYGFFGVGASWVYISIHTYGNTNAALAFVFTAIFIAVLSLFTTLFGFLLATFFKKTKLIILVFPALGLLTEWVRGSFLTGFPWLFLAYSQTNSPFAGYAPIVGTYGVSFLIYFASSLVFVMLRSQKNRKIAALISLLALIVAGMLLTKINWTQPTGKKINVALIQGNIPQEMHWDQKYLDHTIDEYLRLSKPFWHKTDVIIWPEGAIPLPLPQAQEFINEMNEYGHEQNTTLILGIPIQVGKSFNYYNSLISVGNDNNVYHKHLLVPFGEFLPFANLLRGVVGFFNIPMSDMVAGPTPVRALKINDMHWWPYICYEIVYPDYVLASLKGHANALVVISNDAWYGHSWAAQQHAQMAQFAAIATGRYLLLTSNNGVTAIYDQKGNVISALPQFTTASLQDGIFAVEKLPPWAFIGNLSILLLACAVLIVAKILERR